MSVTAMEKIDAYYKLNPKRFRILATLLLEQSISNYSNSMSQNVTICLSIDSTFVGPSLRIELMDVRDLTFRQPLWSLITLADLSITKDQSEDRSRPFLIRESDEQILFCRCRDFVAALV